MSEPKWTPGPWRIDQMNMAGIEIVGNNGDLVHIDDHCGLPESGPVGGQIRTTARANAHLIAAAPELYEALELLLDDVPAEVFMADGRAGKRAEAALARARGEQDG